MDLYIFTVVLGAAGMAAMAFLGFAGSHGGDHGHDTSGHDMGIGSTHGQSITPTHGVSQGAHEVVHIGGVPQIVVDHTAVHGHGEVVGHHGHDAGGWKSELWSWLSPRVLFNFLVGFGATGLIVERLVGPVLALPIAIVGGVAFEAFVVRPIFKSLFRFESNPAQTLEAALMSEGRAVTGFDAMGNGLISVELGGEVVQVLGTQLSEERAAGVRIRAGDTVRIEEVDSKRNRCKVSRIGGSIAGDDTPDGSRDSGNGR